MTEIQRMKWSDREEIDAMLKTLTACIQRFPVQSCFLTDVVETFWTQEYEGFHERVYAQYGVRSEGYDHVAIAALLNISSFMHDQTLPPGMFDERQKYVHYFFGHLKNFVVASSGDPAMEHWLEQIYVSSGGSGHHDPFF